MVVVQDMETFNAMLWNVESAENADENVESNF